MEAALTTIQLSEEAERRLGIQSEPAREEAVARTRVVGGEVMAPPGRSVLVAAPVAGTLSGAAQLEAGDRVARGTAVFELLPLHAPDRDLRIDADRAAKESEARLLAATQRLERLERLLADGTASARAVEEARADHAAAQAEAEAAAARSAAIARSPVGTQGEIVLRAPFDGVVLAVHAAAGQTVAASTPLFEVADLTEVWIRVPLYVGDLETIDATRPAHVAALGGSAQESWRRAARVAGPPSASAGTASADLFFSLSNGDGSLRPGARVSVRLDLTGSEQALLIPGSAVVYDLHGGTWVYEARPSHVFVRRRVDIADEVADKAIVARGIGPGTPVVTAGVAELYGTEFGAGK